MSIIEIVGFIGACLFGFACVPMAWRAYRNGHTKGIPTSSMWLFLFACIFYFGWSFIDFGFHIPFVIGIVETICWLIVIRYRYFPREVL